jgi:hypothetical protein
MRGAIIIGGKRQVQLGEFPGSQAREEAAL